MKGAPNSQSNLNLNLQPLRGIDRILSHFDTTDLWCAICIIVHFMVFLFELTSFFLSKFSFALLNVLGSTWSSQKFLNLQCNELNKRESDFMVC